MSTQPSALNVIPSTDFDENLPVNPAVLRCCNVMESARQAALATGKSPSTAYSEAQQAFRDAMPPLCGAKNIRDFIACVVHGLLIDVLLESTAARLLYAAQVAHNTGIKHPSRSKTQAQSKT
ncbi:MAG TPA: hypothetical protein VK716_13390 [Terracidiphilus sp.]|jgi:hypothetical protein|nr:hypothetical protein [Terracidiphilus sp.]